jgi:hypothetical protein
MLVIMFTTMQMAPIIPQCFHGPQFGNFLLEIIIQPKEDNNSDERNDFAKAKMHSELTDVNRRWLLHPSVKKCTTVIHFWILINSN